MSPCFFSSLRPKSRINKKGIFYYTTLFAPGKQGIPAGDIQRTLPFGKEKIIFGHKINDQIELRGYPRNRAKK